VEQKEEEVEWLKEQCINNTQVAAEKDKLLDIASSKHRRSYEEVGDIQSKVAEEKNKHREQASQVGTMESQLEEQSEKIAQQASSILTKDSQVTELQANILELQQTISFRDGRIQELRAQEIRFHEDVGSNIAEIKKLITDAEAKHAEIEMLWNRVVLLQTGSSKRARAERSRYNGLRSIRQSHGGLGWAKLKLKRERSSCTEIYSTFNMRYHIKYQRPFTPPQHSPSMDLPSISLVLPQPTAWTLTESNKVLDPLSFAQRFRIEPRSILHFRAIL
jgi:chromosome segregation ATPase